MTGDVEFVSFNLEKVLGRHQGAERGAA